MNKYSNTHILIDSAFSLIKGKIIQKFLQAPHQETHSKKKKTTRNKDVSIQTAVRRMEDLGFEGDVKTAVCLNDTTIKLENVPLVPNSSHTP